MSDLTSQNYDEWYYPLYNRNIHDFAVDLQFEDYNNNDNQIWEDISPDPVLIPEKNHKSRCHPNLGNWQTIGNYKERIFFSQISPTLALFNPHSISFRIINKKCHFDYLVEDTNNQLHSMYGKLGPHPPKYLDINVLKKIVKIFYHRKNYSNPEFISSYIFYRLRNKKENKQERLKILSDYCPNFLKLYYRVKPLITESKILPPIWNEQLEDGYKQKVRVKVKKICQDLGFSKENTKSALKFLNKIIEDGEMNLIISAIGLVIKQKDMKKQQERLANYLGIKSARISKKVRKYKQFLNSD